MRRIALFTFLLLLATAPLARAADPAPIWLAVGPPELTAALAPLAEHREAQGFEVRIAAGPVAEAIAAAGRPAYLLLVGDDAPGEEKRPWYLPAPRREFYRWRSVQPERFAADAILGDVDQDLIPDFPVGRIPARSADEVASVVRKILAWESRPVTPGDFRVVAWGGAPGYGGFIDSMATGLLAKTVDRYAPPWADRFILSSSITSPLCGWPAEQGAVFDTELQKGAVLGAIVAHGSPRTIYGMEHDGRHYRWTVERARADFAAGSPTAPLVLLSCDGGVFTGEERCLGEELLFLPGGPVAAIAATTESHPLTNYYTGQGLLRALADGRPRVGDLWLAAQRSILSAREFLVEKALMGAEGSLEDPIDREKLLRDQILLYEIFGDPATPMRLPGALTATVEKAEDGWRYAVTKPEGAISLGVAVRPAKRRPAAAPAARDPETMRKTLEDTNAAAAFSTIEEKTAAEKWTGTVAAPGVLRLTAVTPRGVLVFTTTLK